MLRKFTRYDMDGRPSQIWLNCDNIVALWQNGENRTSVTVHGGGHWMVSGEADDIAEDITFASSLAVARQKRNSL